MPGPNVTVDLNLKKVMCIADADLRRMFGKAKTLAEAYALFNRPVNGARNGSLDAYFAWHREKVSDAAGPAKNGRACVIGPGRCNDFALAPLAERFSEVVLADVDGEAPELARQGLPKGLRDKVVVSVCDASLYVGSLASRAEDAIRRSSSGPKALASARRILFSRPLKKDIKPMPFGSGSFDFVLSDDAIPNFFPIPRDWLDHLLSEKFGPGFSISGGIGPPVTFVTAVAHIIEVSRLLASDGVLAASACTAYATLEAMPGNPQEKRIVYTRETGGTTVLVSMPRLGFTGERHLGLLNVLGVPLFSDWFRLLSSETYELPLLDKHPEAAPVVGEAKTFYAALNEFTCLKKNG